MFISQLRRAVPKRSDFRSLFNGFYSTFNETNEKILHLSTANKFSYLKRPLSNSRLDNEYKKEMNCFNAVYPEFKKVMLSKIPSTRAQERFSEILDYNIFRKNGSHVLTFIKLSKDLNSELEKNHFSEAQIYTMGWIMETLIMAGIMMDDMADDSHYRSGKICWHKLGDNGKILPNELFMLTTVAFSVLGEQFGKTSLYNQIVALLYEADIQASTALLLDFMTKKSMENLDLDEYYNFTAQAKGRFGFEVQIKTALYMHGHENAFNDQLARICSILGYYNSILNDYFDIEGNPYEKGKDYENIKQGDLTWFFKEAMRVVPDDQRKLLLKNYGSDKTESIEKVLQIYNEAKLMEKFKKHEEHIRWTLQNDIDQLPNATIQFRLQQILHEYEKLDATDSFVKYSFVWILF